MYAKIEPSGCIEQHGNVHIRLSFYLNLGDARYDEHHVYVVDETCPIWIAGYQGEVYPEGSIIQPPKDALDVDGKPVTPYDVSGQPVNEEDYQAWLATCRHIWRDNPFHNHFINGDPDITNKEIEDLAAFHLVNFYEAWRLRKSIRSGWDVAHRIYPIRYEEFDTPENFTLRKSQCQQRVDQIKTLDFAVSPTGEGKTFPATSIDVGSAAIDRGGTWPNGYTLINYNNSANDTGTLDTFEIWMASNAEGVKVGTFTGTTNQFTSNDVEVIGNVTSGSKQTFSGKNCDVTSGDWVGHYKTAGTIETDGTGGGGDDYKAGDQFGTGLQTYSHQANKIISLYATGDTPGGTTHTGAATLSGVGTLAGIGRGIFIGKSTLSGLGTLAAIGRRIFAGVATLTGTGSLSAIGRRIFTGAATLSGVGSLAASAVIEGIQYGAATLSGTGSLVVAAVGTFAGKATLAGVGTLAAIGRNLFAGKAILTGTGSLSAIGNLIYYIAAALGYTVEVRDGSGNLLAIFENAHGISLVEQLNRPPMLDFKIPSDDDKISHLDPDNEIWLRNYKSGALVNKFLIGRRRDRRQ